VSTREEKCPVCGLYKLDGLHDCGVPILREAIGVELTPEQERYVRWLAGMGTDVVQVFAGLFRQARQGHIEVYHGTP
jgi:hypothetical protein